MSKRFRKLSHTLYECKYHVGFCPKYRYPLLKDAVAEEDAATAVSSSAAEVRAGGVGDVCPSLPPPSSLVDCAEVRGVGVDGVVESEVATPRLLRQ